MVGDLFLGLDNKIGSIMRKWGGFTDLVINLIHYGFTLLNTIGFSLQNRLTFIWS